MILCGGESSKIFSYEPKKARWFVKRKEHCFGYQPLLLASRCRGQFLLQPLKCVDKIYTHGIANFANRLELYHFDETFRLMFSKFQSRKSKAQHINLKTLHSVDGFTPKTRVPITQKRTLLETTGTSRWRCVSQFVFQPDGSKNVFSRHNWTLTCLIWYKVIIFRRICNMQEKLFIQ